MSRLPERLRLPLETVASHLQGHLHNLSPLLLLLPPRVRRLMIPRCIVSSALTLQSSPSENSETRTRRWGSHRDPSPHEDEVVFTWALETHTSLPMMCVFYIYISFHEECSSLAQSLLWDDSHSQEVIVVKSCVDANIMNVRARI